MKYEYENYSNEIAGLENGIYWAYKMSNMDVALVTDRDMSAPDKTVYISANGKTSYIEKSWRVRVTDGRVRKVR